MPAPTSVRPGAHPRGTLLFHADAWHVELGWGVVHCSAAKPGAERRGCLAGGGVARPCAVAAPCSAPAMRGER